MDEDKQREFIEDAIGEGMSNCCSARVWSPSGDWAICTDCKEHCDVVKEKDIEKDGFSFAELAQIDANEKACALAGCDDNGHKCK